VAWDGSDETGTSVPAGVYFWRLEMGERFESQKMLLVR
jgi:hypothetical protein